VTTLRPLLIAARRGRTQQDIADEIGVTQATVSTWEKEQFVPRKAKLRDVARAYGIPYRRVVDAWLQTTGKGKAA
jgi:transcriptional regulator with XRE-family HTH domain